MSRIEDAPEYRDTCAKIAGAREKQLADAVAKVARLTAQNAELLAACKLALGAFENNNAIDWSEIERAIAKAEDKS